MTTKSGPESNPTQFTVYFSELQDPRRTDKGNFHHLLSDILFLTISAMLCGVSDWSMVKTFGDNQFEWLKKFGTFSKGIPSTDTLERVFCALDAKSFNECFIKWIEAIRQDIKGETIAIDGKTMRGAKLKKNSKNMPHIVSAFAKENGLCLGQVKTSEKSNEITAIPDLLELLALKGCTVTIDAMGCQKYIAAKIIDKNADYILAVKGNQGNLERAILDTRKLEEPCSVHKWEDVGHGRIETRTCKAFSNLSHVESVETWKELKTIFVIESEVYKKSSGETTTETRSYISSHEANARLLNEKTRNHWAVENNLHWTLDVTFGEDASRKRKGKAPENFNILLKTALTLLVNDQTPKLSKKRKRLQAALNTKYREKLLGF
jgi:predicted transposase YbfD/YdcC